MKTFKTKNNWSGEQYKCCLTMGQYANGGHYIGILYWDKEFGAWMPYADATVCLAPLQGNKVALDTNNMPQIAELFRKHGLGRDTGRHLYSGFCAYPVYELNMQKIAEYFVGGN